MFLGDRGRVEIKNISPADIQIDASGTAFYSCLKSATITTSDSTAEIQFTVPSTVTYQDLYTIHWNGSGVLQHLYGPSGLDILQLQKQPVWDAFSWGFVYMSFKPLELAQQYSFNAQGLWRIQMKIFDSNTPSLYVPDGFRVSIHREEYISQQMSLAVGQNVSVDLPSRSGWHNGQIYYFELNGNSSQADVNGALLEYSYHFADTSTGNVYDYSYWLPYNQTVTVTNIGTQPFPLQLWSGADVFTIIDHETDAQGLEFNLDSAALDSNDYYSYTSLDIASTIPLNSSVLLIPNGTRVEDMHRNIVTSTNDAYYTLQPTYSLYKVSLSPYYAYTVLENAVYGTWRLKLELEVTVIHDVAIISVEPYRKCVNQNCSTRINVTVANLGDVIETFNVSLFANSSLVGIQTLTLDNGKCTNLTFTWNTTGVQAPFWPCNCSIQAEASPVSNETNPENNIGTCCVKISIKGDIDGNGKVNIIDISKAATAFAAKPGDKNWNADADINEDQKISIVDISMIAKEFGKTA